MLKKTLLILPVVVSTSGYLSVSAKTLDNPPPAIKAVVTTLKASPSFLITPSNNSQLYVSSQTSAEIDLLQQNGVDLATTEREYRWREWNGVLPSP